MNIFVVKNPDHGTDALHLTLMTSMVSGQLNSHIYSKRKIGEKEPHTRGGDNKTLIKN